MKRRVFLTASLLMLAPWVKAKAAASIGFDEMYEGNPILGLQFSEKLKSLAQKTVSVQGFMAPPLKPEANFLVMTREPVSLCPFCNGVVIVLSGGRRAAAPGRSTVGCSPAYV